MSPTRVVRTNRTTVWIRVVPLVLIAFFAGVLCVQSACSSGTDGSSYTYQ